MSLTVMGMVRMALVDLHYAQAEIGTISDRDSILRSLDHIRQAEAFLMIAMAARDATLTPHDDATLADDKQVGQSTLC
jgi:hypothetical protein